MKPIQLASVLTLFIAFICGCGGGANSDKGALANISEADVMALLKPLGVMSKNSDGGQVVTLSLGNTPFNDAAMVHLQYLINLQELNLADTKISGAGTKYLVRLKELNNLSFARTQVGDESCKNISELSKLTQLDMQTTRLTDVGLKQLHDLKNMRQLYLQNTKVTDEGVEKFQRANPNCIIHYVSN